MVELVSKGSKRPIIDRGVLPPFDGYRRDGEGGEIDPGDNIVTYKQFQMLEEKVDRLIILQKELAANIMEMNRVRQAEAQRKKVQAKKIPEKKPPVNPLKFP